MILSSIFPFRNCYGWAESSELVSGHKSTSPQTAIFSDLSTFPLYWHLPHKSLIFECACMLSRSSHVQLFATLWPVACQAPMSMEFSKQEYWSELPCLSPGDLPDPGIESASLTFPALAGRFSTASATVTSSQTWVQ